MAAGEIYINGGDQFNSAYLVVEGASGAKRRYGITYTGTISGLTEDGQIRFQASPPRIQLRWPLGFTMETKYGTISPTSTAGSTSETAGTIDIGSSATFRVSDGSVWQLFVGEPI